MLACCGKQFYAAEKVVLPKKGMLYRCLEYGHCPHCGNRVSRLIEQDTNYEIFVKERHGIKALRAFEKAKSQRKKNKTNNYIHAKAIFDYIYNKNE